MKSGIRILIVCFVALVCIAKAQNRTIDSLKTLLSKAKTDSARVELMNSLSYNFGTIDLDKGLSYGQQAANLAEKTGYKKGLCMAYNNIGIIYDQKGLSDSSMICYKKSLDMSVKMGNIYLQASALSNIGYIHWTLGEYDKALDFTFRSLKILDTGKNYMATANAIEHVAMIYYDLSDYKNSIKYHRQAIGIYTKVKAENQIGNVYCNLALNYLETSKDSMIYYLKKGEAIFLKFQDHWALGHVYNNIGGVYLEMSKFDQALTYLYKARLEHKLVGDDRGLCATHMSIGSTWLYKNQPMTAKSHIDTAIAMSTAMGMKESMAEAYHNYALVYSSLGKLDSVTKYLSLENDIKDSIFSNEKTQAIADVQTKYDTEKKDLEIAKQNAELEAKENATKRRDTLIIALLSLIVLGVALAYFSTLR